MDILESMPDLLFDNSEVIDAFDLLTDSPMVDVSSNDAEATPPESSSDRVAADYFDDMIEDIIFGLCLEIHRMGKKGRLSLLESTDESQKVSGRSVRFVIEIVDQYGLDVFGQPPMKKQLECVCPHCHRNMAASRFAPHLEKCMGKGRNSSRLASRRIANNTKQESDNDSIVDDHNDAEWTAQAEKKGKKSKKEKSVHVPIQAAATVAAAGGHPAAVKPTRGRKPGGSRTRGESSGDLTCQQLLDNMDYAGRVTLLNNICAAMSEDQKICTRSLRCPLHSERQRQASRNVLLQPPVRAPQPDYDDIQVDIDSYDDTDSQLLRDTLSWDISPGGSPADSTSTVHSVGGPKKRGRHRRH